MTKPDKKNQDRSIFQLFELCHGHGHGNGITWLIKLFLLLQLLQFSNAQVGYAPPPPPPNQFSFHPKFNSSMAIIMVVLVSAFFFLGFFSVYIRQCADRRFSGRYGFSPPPIGGDGRSSRAARGLDAEVIETFPTFTYSSVMGLKIGKGSLECAVCLNEFEDDETLRLLPNCNHVFHPDCIDAWLSSHTTCPVCRANLVPKPGDIPDAPMHIFDPDSEINEPVIRPDTNESPTEVLVQSPDVNPNRPRRTRSTGFRIAGIFSRSHATGHSLVQEGENCDRFTLSLPEEVRNHILNSRTLNRTKSCVAFPRARSTRRGFRSWSSGRNYSFHDQFDHDNRSDRRGFSMTPPFFTRTGSARSLKTGGTGEDVMGTHKSLFRSVRSPFNRFFFGMDMENNNANRPNNVVGERSSDQLRPDNQV